MGSEQGCYDVPTHTVSIGWLQLLVIGPWPHGLLQQLYYCVKTLAKDVLGLRVGGVEVVCPRCRQVRLTLKALRKKAGKADGVKHCGNGLCASKPAAGPGGPHEFVAGEEEDPSDEEEDEEDDEEQPPVDLGVEGFETWTVALGKKEKERREVLDYAMTRAVSARKATSVTAPAPFTALQVEAATAMVSHAGRLVARYNKRLRV